MKIFCDFDTTLKFPFTKKENEFTLALLILFEEYELNIITSRHESETSLEEIKEFCKLNFLNPKNIIFTNGEPKYLYISNSEKILFIDDDETERNFIRKYIPDAEIVNPIIHLTETEILFYSLGE